MTLFLGRTKVGDVVQLAVWRERRQILRPVLAVRAPWQGFTTLPAGRADVAGDATVCRGAGARWPRSSPAGRP